LLESFFTFHGQELINIFENAFSLSGTNEKTLFQYAGRRKVTMKLKTFIISQTNIELSLSLENIECPLPNLAQKNGLEDPRGFPREKPLQLI